MNKSFKMMKIKLFALVVGVVLLAGVVLIYNQIERIQQEYSQKIELEKNVYAYTGFWYEYIGNINSTYFQSIHSLKDVGFYSVLGDAEGNVLVEDESFMVIENGFDYEDRRILLLDEDFVNDKADAIKDFFTGEISEIEIIGECDDTFVYLEELRWKDKEKVEYTYIPKEKETAAKEAIQFEEWTGGRYYYHNKEENDYNVFIKVSSKLYSKLFSKEFSGYKMKMNNEAKSICNSRYTEYINDVNKSDFRYYDSSFDNFKTYMSYIVNISDEHTMTYVFVFNPVKIAIEEQTGLLISLVLFAIISIIIINIVINRLQRQQLEYEAKRIELTRGIAHELKTPLAITKGYIENWEYLDAANQHEYSMTIINEIEHMNKMVMDLGELSNLEMKNKKLNIQKVDFESLIYNTLKRMVSLIAERNISVNLAFDSRQMTIQEFAEAINTKTEEQMSSTEYIMDADLEMMRIVLMNFISNAIKYAGSQVDINVTQNGKKMNFEIINDGKEIAKENIDRVWDVFYKDATNNDSRLSSSGIGLAITKNVLVLHGAKYGCESGNGKTRFWFEMK